jgi:hypothetical protein
MVARECEHFTRAGRKGSDISHIQGDEEEYTQKERNAC